MPYLCKLRIICRDRPNGENVRKAMDEPPFLPCVQPDSNSNVTRMSNEMSNIDNKVKYINYCICEFAASHNMALLEAYDYLSEHGAVAFLDECYEAEHLLSIEEAVADMAAVAQKNGGLIA